MKVSALGLFILPDFTASKNGIFIFSTLTHGLQLLRFEGADPADTHPLHNSLLFSPAALLGQIILLIIYAASAYYTLQHAMLH